MSSNGQWLTGGRRKRSYDSDWSSYERRSNGQQRITGSSGERYNSSNITSSGSRAGTEYNSHHTGTHNRNAASQSGSGGHNAPRNRVRVADYRGSAARVGNLPTRDPQAYAHQEPAGNFRRGGPSSDNNLQLFQSASFLESLRNPPEITTKLPQSMRSTLNEEQCNVVESVLSGHSTFFTGPAGSGKSHVLNSLLKANSQGVGSTNGNPRSIVVTATTWRVHSWTISISLRLAHVTIGVRSEESVSRFLYPTLRFLLWASGTNVPFSELVVCGDFFQLPPIDLANEGFAFEAKCWPEVIKCSVLLKQVFRQKGDTALMSILDEARLGELSPNSVEVLRRHGTLPAAAFGGAPGKEEGEERIIPTLLECRNKQVDKANEVEMSKLSGEVVTYKSRDRGITDHHKKNLRHCSAPERLDLKVGAQVMLLKNIDLDRGLANGSRGVVVRFQRPKSESEIPTGFKKMDFPVVRFISVKPVGKDKCDDESSSASVVSESDNEFVIHPEEWSNKMGDQTISSRVQIPLRLAWSISVHKSQGMTIPNLTVNLQGVFEYGQAYVALSRATELKLLTLRGFNERCFRAHPKVKTFYKLLESGGLMPSPINKENAAGIDSFSCEDDRPPQRPPYVPGQNPYKRQAAVPSNPYGGRQHPVQTNGRFSPNPAQNPARSQPVSASPNLTEDQRRRMEENRRRALAIRMKKQQNRGG
ncbi:hypothetical protein THAOC_19608 [Thalassiosira oceanica]|uniref:DNA helicase Pif1-like 2B domain-containing protein n=1 Tax=Thalassiosira oceanica TaxID=159749 RepID=K0S5E8_THAOC|nr:hypothetical protein THAOC_19608 [Thalassiosira oceanica]|eukprot:EJK60099.1 hypothetical protein THAOC_19608 [Thalassiosira oceanica]